MGVPQCRGCGGILRGGAELRSLLWALSPELSCWPPSVLLTFENPVEWSCCRPPWVPGASICSNASTQSHYPGVGSGADSLSIQFVIFCFLDFLDPGLWGVPRRFNCRWPILVSIKVVCDRVPRRMSSSQLNFSPDEPATFQQWTPNEFFWSKKQTKPGPGAWEPPLFAGTRGCGAASRLRAVG